MSIQYPIPLPFPVALDQEPMRACPRPARPRVVADLSKVEDPSRLIGEFVAVWNGAVLGVKHFTRKADRRSFRIGEHPDCDVWLPLEQLGGRDDVHLVRVDGDRIAVTVLPGATGQVRRADGSIGRLWAPAPTELATIDHARFPYALALGLMPVGFAAWRKRHPR